MPHKAGNGAILGIASEDGSPAKKRVTLMDRSDMTIVKKTVSDEYGAYAFTGLNPDTDDYIVFAVDDDGTPKKSALIFDYVKPIPAHQGGFYWANWYYLAMQREPVAMVLGVANTTNTDTTMPYGVGLSYTDKAGFLITANEESLTQGAASIPTTIVDRGTLGRVALNRNDSYRDTTTDVFSSEWVLDTSKVTSGVSIMLYGTRAGFNDNSDIAGTMFFSVRYLASNKTIQLVYKNAAGSSYSSSMSGQEVALTYTIPEDLRGATLYIVANIQYGLFANLYINGSLVSTADLSGKNVKAGTTVQRNRVYAQIGGYAYPNDNYTRSSLVTSTFSSPLFSFYNEIITSAAAQEGYEALFLNTLPRVTGYMKAVIEDYPLIYYRLHDLDESLFAIDALRPYAINAQSKLYKSVPNKIKSNVDIVTTIGGAGTDFSGGGLAGFDAIPIVLDPYSLSIDFFAKPKDITPYNTQSIVRSGWGSDTLFSVSLSATKKITVGWMEGVSTSSIVFAHVVDMTDVHHYAITISKVELKAILYVDGFAIEQVAVSGASFKSYGIALPPKPFLFVSGVSNAELTAVSQPYTGYLSELAIYPTELTPAAVKRHYEARLVV